MTKSLAGKVAIVTGVSAERGIGRATARKLAGLGADLVLADLDLASGLQALADEIVAAGGRSLAVAVDVRDVAQIEACVEAACQTFGGIDILVNNAGTTAGAKPFLEISDADWDLSYAVNLRGPAQFCRAVIPAMIRRGGGAIVNNASLAGAGGVPGLAPYAAAKHGVVGLTRSVALECAEEGIRVNAILTGNADTPLYRSLLGVGADAPRDSLDAPNPSARVADPDEIAAFVAWLLSSEASFVTGAALAIDGGFGAT